MHEVSIAENLVRILEDEMVPYKGTRLETVKLRVGELSGVVPDALRFAFEICSRGTVAEGATLEIDEVPARGYCKSCKREVHLDVPFLICPLCGTADIDVLSGRELEIENIYLDEE